ncbi:MAG TPA: MauE/DoxX family redox-associated membrane protein [Flavisolibacter sp.]|nr:MauE/DoxX family redox-associated membrane protein [Flavisolibacter sp.]
MAAFNRHTFIDTLSALLIFLFLYTATDKLLHQQKFLLTIGQSPLIKDYAMTLSWIVPSLEIVAASFLLAPKTRVIGFGVSIILMSAFTAYVGYTLAFSQKLPCSCGGVISQMSWGQHLLFNLIFTSIASAGFTLSSDNNLFIAINRNRRKPVETSRHFSSFKTNTMKKYLLGVFAVILAVSLSAFTTSKPVQKPVGPVLYWYHVSGTQTVGSKINSSQIDKDGAMSTLTDCDDQATEFCLYGSSNPNLSNFDFGQNPPEEQIIRYNQ